MTRNTRAHLVWAHPREQSMTSSLVRAVNESLVARGYVVDELDLYRSGFDPVLHEADEPNWDDPSKVYSDEVETLVGRVQNCDIVVVVFPLWWYSLPAILKGYIDRVWNFGRLYDDPSLPKPSAIVWVALAGTTNDALESGGHIDALANQLDAGIAGYCGIANSRTVVLPDTIDSPDLAAYVEQVSRVLDESIEISRGQ